ncbi:MerR family DNA-binding transcriptional regulator [Tepidibacter formicigenes]|jgi:excisionase family DNA binding protein|uniref:DNA binding domain-containing protein, excisionase family n=1 Tax=Tepidibacter formicigenes DSM 15518 TaxID=1123349 RepID=A0A1M6QTY0_9FIRM|nr:MerR family DNA-binding transcriptional regulator [Tepidibacter formicigenes]SHK23548.1 DNA binding domain-containing protein, excisionase family [Tepidibacter formicigenes DSM 15518]
MNELISISEASRLLGVTIKTLKIWDNEGKLKAHRTLGGHRRYRLSDIEKLLEIENQNTERNVFIYCRVSTKKQQQSGNLERQKQRLIDYCNERQYNVVHIFI